MSENHFTERKKMILRAIIDAHIEHGEPVGSKYLVQEKQIAYSSATIRNEMAELEEMGYLEQPHTSAGRVPSELGYRFYVDSLIERYHTTRAEIAQLKTMLSDKITELDRILESASRLASAATNYTALAMKPRAASAVVTRYETVYLDARSFILVMMMPAEVIQTKCIRLGFDLTRDAVARLGALLNELLVNITADQITLPLIMEMERRMAGWDILVSPIIKTIYETMNSLDGGELKFEGVNRLLEYPEYADVHKFKNLLELFERKDDILDIVSGTQDDKINVYIGSENAVDIMSDSSLVFRTIRKDGRVVGAIGIIGPRRMDYSKVIATIGRLSGGIMEIIDEASLPPSQDGSSEDPANRRSKEDT